MREMTSAEFFPVVCGTSPISVEAASQIGGESASRRSSKSNRGQQRKRFYKTRLCPYHFKKGSVCKGGAHCSYAHSFQELRPSVDLTKTKLCQDFLNGLCMRNTGDCPFAHGNAELRPARSNHDDGVPPLICPSIRRPPVAPPPSTEPWPSDSPKMVDSIHGYAPNRGGQFYSAYMPASSGPTLGGRSMTFDATAHFVPQSACEVSSSRLKAPYNNTVCRSTETTASTQSGQIHHYQLGTPKGSPPPPPSNESSSHHSPTTPVNDYTPSPFARPPASAADSDTTKDDARSTTSDLVVTPTGAAITAPNQEKPDARSFIAGPVNNDEPKLTLSISQLANIILAAHAADSPTELVSDVLTYIYRS